MQDNTTPHLLTEPHILTALSPLDGRYHSKCAQLREYFSEFALMRVRVEIEVKWLFHLSQISDIDELPKISPIDEKFMYELFATFSMRDADMIKFIDEKINHDVKAVENFIKGKIDRRKSLVEFREFVHFACTSDDINNLSYALLLKRTREEIILPQMQRIIDTLRALAKKYALLPMLARTHGQPASPTTVGKEFANFTARLERARDDFAALPIMAKFNGASGNFNAHLAAYPQLDWPTISEKFIKNFGITPQALTTQIEPRDYIAALCDSLCRFNTIALDLDRDMWGYISLGYFRRKVSAVEVGSSVMPHKINPIDFENSEGNIGIANALLRHFSEKLPVSRWQRDLSDSTVLRNLGVAIGHSMLALEASVTGLSKLAVNPGRLRDDLDDNWEVLAEAVQTVMRRHVRRHGIKKPYEKIKRVVRGGITAEEWHTFINDLDIPLREKRRLLKMKPTNYTGNAAKIAKNI